MEKQLIVTIGKAKPENAHQIVQDALRSAATASTSNSAIESSLNNSASPVQRSSEAEMVL